VRQPQPGLRQHIHPPYRLARLQWLALAAVAVFIVLTGLHAGDSAAWTAFDNVGEALAVLPT
jgi:hypothetical protein